MLLDVRVLGPMEVRLSGAPLAVAHERGVLLLAWLSIWPGERFSRDRLAELLWPEEPDGVARRRLRQVLYTLRQALEEDTRPVPFLEVGRETLALPRSPLWSSDLLRFWDHVAAVEAHPHRRPAACLPCLEHLQAALAEVGGPLLEGLQLPEGGGPELEAVRAALREACIAAHLHRAEHALAQQAWDTAREQGEQVGRLAALDERGIRVRMQALLGEGRRAEAGALYRAFAAELEQAGALPPSDLTEELYQDTLHTVALSDLGGSGSATALPQAADRLVGREALMLWIAAQISLREVRLLTLCGLGGIGKTRLVMEAAARLAATFRDGAWLVEARDTHTAAELVLAIRAAVGLQHRRGADALHELGDWLRPREALLVLDNLEQNEAAADVVAALLRQTPDITVLVSSRTRLGLRAEHVRLIEGLDAEAACALWWTRARQLRHDLALSPDVVADLCRSLGGLPLAIELSAAAVADGADVGAVGLSLHSGFRDSPTDHRSIRALLASHLHRLEPGLVQALAALAVFRGRLGADDAAAVGGVSPEQLARLERAALLSPEPSGCWSLHPLVRAYLQEQWPSPPEAHTRHRRWFLDLDRERSLEQLRLEREDIQAAWRSTVAAQDTVLLAARVSLLDRLLFRLGWYHEAVAWYGEALAGLEAAALEETVAHRRLLAVAGIAAWRLGDGPVAEQHLRRAVAAAETADDPGDIGQANLFLGFVLRNMGRVQEALPLLEAAAASFQRAGRHHDSVRARYNLTTACYDAARLEEARTGFLDLLPELLALELESTRQVAEALLGLTEVLLGDRGGLPRIMGAVREMKASDNPLTTDGLNCLTVAELLLGRPVEARRRARAARELYAQRNFAIGAASMACLEAIAAAAGRLPTALKHTIEAVEAAVTLDSPRTLAEAALAVAWLLRDTPAAAAPWAATVAALPEPIAVLQALTAKLGPLPPATPIPPEQLQSALIAWRAERA